MRLDLLFALVSMVFAAVAMAGTTANEKLKVTVPAFQHGEIPSRFTCEGEENSPSIEWSAIPAGAQSLALIVDDPDAPDPAAPKMTWVHWVIYDIPPTSTGLPEQPKGKATPAGTAGKNSWGRAGWGGPCPPVGRHRYFFKLYALDTKLNLRGAADKDAVLAAMKGHVLAQGEAVGTYQKKKL